jgi:hypothetical protein
MYKKAQISEGLTWIVATIAIIIILLFSVFISSFFFADGNQIKNSFFSSNLNQKSMLSYLLTKENGKTIYSEITSAETLNNENGNLALKVFRDLYKNDYKEIWFGISKKGEGNLSGFKGQQNEFFGKEPLTVGISDIGPSSTISKEKDISILKFADKKFLEAIFVK